MISAVVLNWGRPHNLQSILLPILERSSYIDEIIISHGRRDTMFEYESEHCSIVHRDDADLNPDYGCALRFVAAADARNDTVLSLDDDIVIPESSLAKLLDEFARDPDVIHSLYGRNPDRKLGYCIDMRFGEVTYAVCNAALLSKRLVGLFFEHAPLLDELAEKQARIWYAEDLFMSLVSIKNNRRLNRAYPLPRIELLVGPMGVDGTRAISERPGHLDERTRFSQLAIPTFGVGDLVKTSPGYSTSRRLKMSLGRLLR